MYQFLKFNTYWIYIMCSNTQVYECLFKTTLGTFSFSFKMQRERKKAGELIDNTSSVDSVELKVDSWCLST